MRSIDKLIIGSFTVFFIFAISIDYINSVATVNEEIINENTSKWIWPPQFVLKLFYWWCENVDPILLHNDYLVKYLTFLSPFMFAPFYLIATYAIYNEKQWIRMPMIIFSLILFFDLNYFFYQAVFGTEKAKNLLFFILGYGYYQIFPLILIYRFWPKNVFKNKSDRRKKN
ncbi:unnamed protein product [Rotaria socialis]|uniref:EXPERA domain-containing protein n=1 Tax=Rotaria socialis TaxID=392032 RepID=A0A817VT14_9BILA|nr:unnamed protein product [Rotaria socialis]CAF3322396.1 unnamed protein product [Rotaria socialis]CAF3345308.1 unnamed protein product [Rotaria socialis]CAF3466889.1 unnamed protein product [Rotaria socialis]CAF3490990.1 unnamed protein product [Rotaria socialis]